MNPRHRSRARGLETGTIRFDATFRRAAVGARADGAMMRKVSGGVDPVLRASGGASSNSAYSE